MAAISSVVFLDDVSSSAVLAIPLHELPTGSPAEIVGLSSKEGSETRKDLCRRLSELGFLQGERVRVIARGFAGGEPLAVRVGTATFALRRVEAECISVQPLPV